MSHATVMQQLTLLRRQLRQSLRTIDVTMRMVLADKRMHEARERRKRHNGDIDFGLYPDGADGIKAIKDVVGMKSRLAKHLGISRQAVTHWKKVPLNRLDEVAAISGIPRERLRPDIFSRK